MVFIFFFILYFLIFLKWKCIAFNIRKQKNSLSVKRTKALWGKWLSPCLRQEKNKVSFDILLFQKVWEHSKTNGIVSKGSRNWLKGLPLAKFRTMRASKIIMTIINDNMLNDCDRRKREFWGKGKKICWIRNIDIMIVRKLTVF